jgi:hypothetical protein
MDPFTSLELAELRRHDLAREAANARLARVARRARRRPTIEWRRRIAHWGQRLRPSRTRPTPAVPMPQPASFDDVAAALASNGPAAVHDALTRFVTLATARGATPSLLSILADESQPDVARQRAFARLATELANPGPDTAGGAPDRSDAA